MKPILTKKELQGNANKVGGVVVEAIGKATGNERMKISGKKKQIKGEVQTSFENIKEVLYDEAKLSEQTTRQTGEHFIYIGYTKLDAAVRRVKDKIKHLIKKY